MTTLANRPDSFWGVGKDFAELFRCRQQDDGFDVDVFDCRMVHGAFLRGGKALRERGANVIAEALEAFREGAGQESLFAEGVTVCLNIIEADFRQVSSQHASLVVFGTQFDKQESARGE